MMIVKPFVVLCCLMAAVIADEKYTDKYDNIDIHEILTTDRLFIAYLNCILDKGKCTPEAKELKSHIEDALETGCSKCTEKQKEGTKTIISHLIEHKREAWKELCAKYDPNGVWRKKYEDVARKEGIDIPEE